MKLLDTIRYSEWWVYKLCPLLAVGYATILMSNSPFLQASFHFIFLLGSISVGAAYVCLINDLTDIQEDLACGKPNRMVGLSPRIRWILPVVCLLLGSIFFFYLWPDKLSFILYPLSCVAFSLYSFEPFRLKRRGFWGVLADACGSHFFPSLYFVSAMSYFTGQPIHWLWFASVGVWALCYGLRGILWHQFRDRKNDILAGINTFASTRDPRRTIHLGIIIFTIELVALCTMLLLIGITLNIIFLVLYAFVTLIRYRMLGQQPILIQTPPSENFQILMIDYYQVFLPISLLIAAAIQDINALWVLSIHILFFPKKIWCIIKDMFLSFRRIILQKA